MHAPTPPHTQQSRLAFLAWHIVVGALNLAFVFTVARLTEPAPSGEYFLTHGLMDAWWARWFWMGPVQLGMGYVAGRLGHVTWWGALGACAGGYMLPVMVEFNRDDTSHNLIPFELAFWAFTCGPVALGALLGRSRAAAATRDGAPGGT